MDVKEFVSHLRLKNLSPRTIALYEWVLKDFFRSCPELSAPTDATFDHLRVYVAALQARGRAAKTVADRVTILKQFFGYLLMEGRVSTDPSLRLPMPKVGKRLPKAVTLQETEALLAALPSDWKTSAPSDTREAQAAHVKQRDRVLFEVMYAGGLRVGESVRLRVADIDFAEGSLRVLGKGKQERRVYLEPRIMKLLQEYVDGQHLPDLLFQGLKGKPLSTRQVAMRIKQYAKAAGIQRPVSPHTLCHSIAVHYLQGGAPVNFVQGLLGHASLATTGKYLQLTDQTAKQIALGTVTALDRSAETEKNRKARERPDVYQIKFRECDEYTSRVPVWLSA